MLFRHSLHILFPTVSSKFAKWYLSQEALPYWYLLLADCATLLLAGLTAYTINHKAGLQIMPSITVTLLSYLPCYLLGFYLFKTYRDTVRHIGISGLLRVGFSLCTGLVLVMLLRIYVHSDEWGSVIRARDLVLQCTVAFMMMAGLRMLVRFTYESYIKRHNLTGIYGLPDADLLNVELSSLLPRQEIEIDMESVQQRIAGKRILVTGAAGSIGHELVKLLAQLAPQELLLIDTAETPLHDVRLTMLRHYPQVKCRTIVANICHHHRMEQLFEDFRPEMVFHAAAYKHVPMMEDNPTESVLNNVDGTVKLADLAVAHRVESFVMVSTDKAVNPTNIMGCSKRICEIYCQSLNNSSRNTAGCQFITTRFGNVLGSNGSVVPAFREQIRNGGPVYVTHPDIERYFMLIPEACKLVLQAATIGEGGKIYVFDMGKPVKIAQLAQRMIKLSGKSNIQIVYSGLRPGEKLYEELLNDAELVEPTSHQHISIARVREYDYEQVKADIQALIDTARHYDVANTVARMQQLVPEYHSPNPIYSKQTT